MTSFLLYLIYIHLFCLIISILMFIYIGTNEMAILEITTIIHKIVSFNSELNVLFMVKNHTEQLICIAYQQVVYF